MKQMFELINAKNVGRIKNIYIIPFLFSFTNVFDGSWP